MWFGYEVNMGTSAFKHMPVCVCVCLSSDVRIAGMKAIFKVRVVKAQ